MKRVSYWLQSLATLTVVLLVASDPVTSKGAGAATNSTSSDRNAKAIEIFVPPPERRTAGICPDVLAPVIDSIIDAPTFSRARWGILVESLSSTDTLYSRNPDDFLIPASNVKLLTTAAALQTLDLENSSESASLRELIRVTNLNSDNGYADALLRRLGGPQVVREALTPLGIDPDGYRQVDGSGLSRFNVATPATFVAILKAMRFADGSDLFYTSLPVAGVSGTLRNRFHNTPAQGRVHAKTGTLNGVRALSGYLEHPDYGAIAFSIMVNQPSQSGETMLEAIDQVVVQLTRLTSCE